MIKNGKFHILSFSRTNVIINVNCKKYFCYQSHALEFIFAVIKECLEKHIIKDNHEKKKICNVLNFIIVQFNCYNYGII